MKSEWVAVMTFLLAVPSTNAVYSWEGLKDYEEPNFLCQQFPIWCTNFLESIGCGTSPSDFTNIGCPNYPEVSNNITNWTGKCTCNSPVYTDEGSTHIPNELVANRIAPEMSWMLEPWETGPPYDYAESYKVTCELVLHRLGCPSGDATVIADSTPGSAVYKCQCGNFHSAEKALPRLIIDQLNKFPITTTPIFEDPVYLSTALTVCMVLIMGKLGAITAVYFKLPAIVGYILIGIGIQNFLNPMILKGPGFPYPSFATEAKTFALTIILLRAGLSIELDAIRREWVPNVCLAFIPYMCEFFAFCYVGVKLFGWTGTEMGLFSAMISSLGPSLIIPGVLNLLASTKYDYGYVPRIILMTAPIEAVLATLLFGIFGILNQSATDPLYPWVKVYPLYANCLLIPLNITFSIVLGFIIGYFVSRYINYRITQKNEYLWLRIQKNLQLGSSTADLLFVLVVSSYTMMCLCTKQYIQQSSGVLVVFTISMTLQKFCDPKVAKDIMVGLKGIWIFAEVFLFTFVGTNLSLHGENGPLIGQRAPALSTVRSLVSCLAAGTASRLVGHLLIAPFIMNSFPVHRKSLTWMGNFSIACFLGQLPKATIQATLGGAAFAQHLLPGAAGVNKALIIYECSAITVLIYASAGTLISTYFATPLFLKLSNWDKEAGWSNKTGRYLPESQFYSPVASESTDTNGPDEEAEIADIDDEEEEEIVPRKSFSRKGAMSEAGFVIPEDQPNTPDTFFDLLERVTHVAHTEGSEGIRRLSLTYMLTGQEATEQEDALASRRRSRSNSMSSSQGKTAANATKKESHDEEVPHHDHSVRFNIPTAAEVEDVALPTAVVANGHGDEENGEKKL